MHRTIKKAAVLIFILFAVLQPFHVVGEKSSGSSEPPRNENLLLPGNDEIQGWKKDGEILTAPNPPDLFKVINGGATLYLKHGFQSFSGQVYKDSRNVEVEVSIFDQGSSENAHQLYRDPMVLPKPARVLENFGDEARVDERGLFHYGIEFVKDRYFVRVIIQEKSEKGLDTIILFSRLILQRIKLK